nr:ribonuclease H-like domain, reverse transcriptase, RNA-dependent DNA polymerase [Tanacetum cinerariifolium]
MVAYLSKSDASEGFSQIINFLNGSSIKYALTVNLNIYVSCIKQFWTTVAVKQVNDVTRLQALVDTKKIVITKATIRDALHLDNVEGVDYLPNEEIFTELARIGYKKPSTKLTFYKAFFSSQWKFLIHTVLQCMSAKRTSWNEFSSSMASAVICLSTVGDLSTHTTKYASPALTQKVFTNIRRVRKEFSRVETPLFEGMLVEQKIKEAGDAYEHVEEVTTGDDAHGDDSAAHGEVPIVTKEPSIPSPTPLTPPLQPPQDLLSTSQVQQTPPQSPQMQPPSPPPQPQQAADFPMSLFQEAIDACAALTRRVEHLEYDKVAQALEITKLKRRVKKLEKRNKVRVLKLRRLQRVGTSQRVDTSNDTMMDDESNQGRMIAEMDKDDAVVLMDAKEEDKKVEEAKLITEVVTAASETVTAASAIVPTAEPQVYAATLTAAPVRVAAAPSRRKKGVIIRDPEEESTTSTIIPAETKSKDNCKEILVEEPKPPKKKQQIEHDKQFARKLHAELNKDIDWDEAIDHVKLKAKEDPAVKRYQAMKRKPQTEAQARKNMMMYLKNVVGFKLDYFKGMSYNDICLIFKAKFNLNVDFLLKTKEQIEEEENRASQTINETPVQKAAKRRKLNGEYLKVQTKLGIWYPRELAFDLEAYLDTDYAGANLDRKSTTGGCQFFGKRLVSWQCKKQTTVATSTTEAEHHFIRDAYDKKLIQVLKIHTDDNVADLLTKAFDMGCGCYDDYLMFFGMRIEGNIWGNKAKTRLNIDKGNFNKLDDLVGKGVDYAVNEGRSTDKIKVLNAETEGVSAAGETLSTTTLAVSTARSRMKRMFKRQKTDVDLEKEEQLRIFLNIIPNEEREVDYAVLDKSLPCLSGIKNWLVQKKMALGKDFSNSLLADSLPKTIWFLTHHAS